MKYNIVLFGPPGYGKGTQAIKIANKYELIHVSTGDILRAEVANQSELGKMASVLMQEGKLVPDEIVIEMIRNKFSQYGQEQGFIFDGFPRTVAQAEALDSLLAELVRNITCVISLQVATEELVNRLLLRGEIEGRKDDNQETIQRRLEEYHQKTAPVSDYYKGKSKLYVIDGNGAIDIITNRIFNVIDLIVSHTV
jgi:adenylate kinase